MLQQTLTERFPGVALKWSEYKGQQRVVAPAAKVWDVLKACRDDLHLNQLTDITAVDHLEMPDAVDRFEVVYLLLDVDNGTRLSVHTFLNEPELHLPTVTNIWFGADWLERECYDMFGVVFKGHPNFKRLLLPQEFASFPLRKDYPQQGRGERHNFPVITRAEG
jgi:NADH-quinone oxidoreductase subunit C